MPSPIHTFIQSAERLKVKPLEFWPENVSRGMIADIRLAVQKLKGILEKKSLVESRAYSALQALEKTVQKTFDEFRYIQGLSALADVYAHAPSQDEKTKALVSQLGQEVAAAKKRVLEYHLLIEALEKKALSLSPEQQTRADLKLLQEVGIFYVLEYTLQVLALWPRLNDKGKNAILHDGLSIKEGNLPAYLPLEDTFRKDLCLKIFDKKLRDALLHAFYDFEEFLITEDIKKIGPALKQFNLSLLQAFDQKGLKTFKALIYKPFGNNLPMETLISSIKGLQIS